MNPIHIATAALNQTPLDFDGNKKRILKAIDMAPKDCAILCLPELCITGYGCEDAFFYHFVQDKAYDILIELQNYMINHRRNMILAVGLPVNMNDALFNCCAIIAGYKLKLIPKQNLCTDGVHYETRWFKPWPAGKIIDNDSVGDIVFRVDNGSGLAIGVEICEDAWVANRPGISLAKRGCDIILNPSASHFAFDKHIVRRRFVEEGSRAFHCVYVYSNLLGNESGRLIYDGDTLIASNGKIVAAGERLSFQDVVLTSAVVDVDENRTRRTQDHSYDPDIDESKEVAIDCTLTKPKELVGYSFTSFKPVDWAKREIKTKDSQFSHAVSLGLFDYMRKSHSQGFVLSLSGGADSAACALLVKHVVNNAAQEMTADEFIERTGLKVTVPIKLIEEIGWMGDYTKLTEQSKWDLIIKNILVCVYQGTKNSSDETKQAAKQLSEDLGFPFYDWDIEGLVNSYECMVGKSLGRVITWETDDLAKQNIQARVRSPGIWMLANIRNSLLICTNNRSEAAVGYATMDGDTSGSLCPIGGIDKNFLLQWLRGQQGTFSILPWGKGRGIAKIIKMQPTAELKPLESGQTDEKDLMPYWALDLIEKACIRDKMSQEEAFGKVKAQIIINPALFDKIKSLSNSASDDLLGRGDDWEPRLEIQIRAWVETFYKLFCKSQWKREKSAPSFQLDDESLDPKSWCRFPILSGGL